MKLGERYREEGKAIEMSDLIKQVRPILKNFSKAKAAKLVRGLVDMFLDIDRAEGSKGEAEVQLCQVMMIPSSCYERPLQVTSSCSRNVSNGQKKRRGPSSGSHLNPGLLDSTTRLSASRMPCSWAVLC